MSQFLEAIEWRAEDDFFIYTKNLQCRSLVKVMNLSVFLTL